MVQVVKYVYPSVSGRISSGTSFQSTSTMYSQPKVLFVYPLSSLRTNIQSSMTSNVNQEVTSISGNSDTIIVTLSTPNLQQIQSFPVVSRQGNIHIHQDPMNGQLYQMTDEIHQSINQLVYQENLIDGVITGGVMQPNLTTTNLVQDSVSGLEIIDITPSNIFKSVFLKDFVSPEFAYSTQPNLFIESFLISIYGDESKINEQI